MGAFVDFPFRRPPALHRVDNCSCQRLASAPDDLAQWPWTIRTPDELHAFVASLGEETHEWLLALFVDDKLKLLSVETIARGSAAECPVPVGLIFRRGMAVGATAFFLVHNHPSGDARPSKADRQMTERLRYLGEQMNLTLLEHVIVAGDEMERIPLW